MSIITSAINSFMRTKPGKWAMGPYSPISPVAIATVSCLTKDGTNCVYYVKQSLTNDRIPDDKRNFVAGLDLANGLLNIVTQLAFALYLNGKLNKFYKSKIGENLIQTLPRKIFENYAAKDSAITVEAAKNLANKFSKTGEIGLSVLATLFATQIVCKRIIVPFLATPMATFFKNYFDKKSGKIPSVQDTVTFEKNVQVASNVKHENLPECFKNFMK